MSSKKSKKIELICPVCGKIFERYLSTIRNINNVFCSRECKNIKYKENCKGENNPNWRGGRHQNICECGRIKDFRAKKCAICANLSFPKNGEQRDGIEKETLAIFVLNSRSVVEISKLTGLSRHSISKFIKEYNLDISYFYQAEKLEDT